MDVVGIVNIHWLAMPVGLDMAAVPHCAGTVGGYKGTAVLLQANLFGWVVEKVILNLLGDCVVVVQPGYRR